MNNSIIESSKKNIFNFRWENVIITILSLYLLYILHITNPLIFTITLITGIIASLIIISTDIGLITSIITGAIVGTSIGASFVVNIGSSFVIGFLVFPLISHIIETKIFYFIHRISVLVLAIIAFSPFSMNYLTEVEKKNGEITVLKQTEIDWFSYFEIKEIRRYDKLKSVSKDIEGNGFSISLQATGKDFSNSKEFKTQKTEMKAFSELNISTIITYLDYENKDRKKLLNFLYTKFPNLYIEII
jgi:hypothetical protein